MNIKNIRALDLVELNVKDQQQVTGGMEIGFLSLMTSIITEKSELIETKSFSIHWDESGITFKLQ